MGTYTIVFFTLKQILSIPLLIISSIALDHIQSKFLSSIPENLNDKGKELVNVDYNQMIKDSTDGSSIVIALSSFIILYEMILIAGRFININIINRWIKIFLSIVSGKICGQGVSGEILLLLTGMNE